MRWVLFYLLSAVLGLVLGDMLVVHQHKMIDYQIRSAVKAECLQGTK